MIHVPWLALHLTALFYTGGCACDGSSESQVKLLFRHVRLCGQQHHKASLMQAVYLSCCVTPNPVTP